MALPARRKEESVVSLEMPGMPVPALSSASRDWGGVVVEHYRVERANFIRQYPDHVVTVFLRGPLDILQTRRGRSSRRIMHAGDIIVAPAGEPKAIHHEEEAELLKVRIAPSLLGRVAAEAAAPGGEGFELLDNFGTRDARIDDIARRLLDEARTDGIGGRLYAESLSVELCVHLLRCYSSRLNLVDISTAVLPRYKLRRITDYINDNLREDLTLNRLAETLAMSPFHFARAFRRATGLAPHRYLLQRRIERAKILLRETELSVTDIAHQIGYSSQSSFSVLFRRVTGQTPRRFRVDA